MISLIDVLYIMLPAMPDPVVSAECKWLHARLQAHMSAANHRCVSKLAEVAVFGLSNDLLCRQRAGFLPGEYRPAVASDAGSSRAPFRPPRPIMSTAAPGASFAQPNATGQSQQQHPSAPSQPARGLGQYSAEVAQGISGLSYTSGDPSAQPASLAACWSECLAAEQIPENLSQHQQRHEGSQGPKEPGAHELFGQPVYGQPISEQLRAPGSHMRARRRPLLEETVTQDSRARQPAEQSTGSPPAGQTLLPDTHGLPPIAEADLSGVSPEQLGDLNACIQPQEISRPDTQPLEPGLHSVGELSAAERSAAERRRQSREFVAQVARESAALHAALAGSTSSSEPSAQRARAEDGEQPAAADEEEICSPDSSPAEAPADAHRPDEASLAAWREAAAPEEREPMARQEALQDHLPELQPRVQEPHIESSSPLGRVPEQAALPSQHEHDTHCASTRAMQADGPGMPTASSPAHSDNEPDIVVDLSSPSPVLQQPAVESQGASQQQASPPEQQAQSSSDGHGTQPRASQPLQPVSSASQGAAGPQQTEAGLYLEVKNDRRASPVRLSLNFDLTNSSKQTPANGSSQSAVPPKGSPRVTPCITDLSQHAGSQPVSVHSLSEDPLQLQHSSAAGEASSMASLEDAPAKQQQTPAAAQQECLQLTDVPLSALHPRGLFMTQSVGAAAGATLVSLQTSHGQQPRHLSTHNRDGTYARPQSDGDSQGPMDRHSDQSAPAVQPQPMHAQTYSQPDTLDVETGSPCSSDRAHGAPDKEGEGLQAVQRQQLSQRGQDRDSTEGRLHAFKPCRQPPTREELQASMQELGILGIQHQGAFYGKPADVPERPIGTSLQPTAV